MVGQTDNIWYIYVWCMFNVHIAICRRQTMTREEEKGEEKKKKKIKNLRFALLAGDVKQLSLSFLCLSPTWTLESTELERRALIFFIICLMSLMHIMCVNCKWETNWVIIIMLLLSGTGMRRTAQKDAQMCRQMFSSTWILREMKKDKQCFLKIYMFLT